MNLLKILFIISILYNCQSEESVENAIIDIIGQDQKLSVNKVIDLSSIISETSGLINFNNRIITHNDSGGEPELYEIDILTGDITRTVKVLDVENRDMEDIAQDDNFIYLCDIGNNSNNRTDQTIYKINKSEYLNNDQVKAEKIMISYKEQTNFTKSNRSTNFDAEAVVNIGNSLFLFTKNWGDLKTTVYNIPKAKGNYVLSKIDSYNINGLITGAAFNKKEKTVLLTGYSNFTPFVVKLSDFSQNNPLDGKVEKKTINVNGSFQIEGIASNPDGSYYISAEEQSGLSAILYKLIY